MCNRVSSASTSHQIHEQDSEFPENGKPKSNHKAKSPRLKLTGLESTQKQKSLRDDWEKTLAKKSHSTETESVDFSSKTTKEIPLHHRSDEQKTHKYQEKPDPIWAPYEDRPKTAEKIQTTALAIEAEPAESVSVPEPKTLDPSLAHEAHLRAQAVATIASEHALMSTPSYKEQLPKEAQEIIEQLRPSSGHHIEQSVWHNIEVDEAGHATKDSNFNYGEAFLNEQKAETNALFNSDEGPIAAASGQLAVGLPASSNDPHEESLLSGNSDPNSQINYQKERYDNIRTSQNNLDPLLWIILIVVIIAIILALVI